MKLSIGIVGLPNVGKSTLFKALTHNDVHIANYPFATIDPNVGIVQVPDERLSVLTKLSASKKTIPAIVEFFDIAGLVKGASQGQGLGNQFLSHIRDVQAIVHVVRCFTQEDIIHVEQTINPLRDIDIIHSELILKDLESIQKRIAKAEGEARTGDKQKIQDLAFLKQLEEILLAEKPLFTLGREINEHPIIKEMVPLTAKPQLYLLNGSESDVSQEIIEKITSFGNKYVILNLSQTTDLAPLITKAYELLNLISFFTTGEDETRAWTIEKGWKAPQAAGTIHTDFEQKFIRAEVVSYTDLVASGGWNQSKQKGKMRLEGKDYVVQDGDVVVVRHG